MAPAPEPGTLPLTTALESPAQVDHQSTRLMLATAAFFLERHLEEGIADLGITPIGAFFLGLLADGPQAEIHDLAQQGLISNDVTTRETDRLVSLGCAEPHSSGGLVITNHGRTVLTKARQVEDELLRSVGHSPGLRHVLQTLIDQLRQ
ncbi:hypothetical protein [Arthrobacter sp. H5]|uniref:hypothetical protein n=1 Tax=Arthrobacter sp. H5 TaxID=1267973 RepID=UPI000483D986|nr:hypothetical protein [Arthrobacter sp. H5]